MSIRMKRHGGHEVTSGISSLHIPITQASKGTQNGDCGDRQLALRVRLASQFLNQVDASHRPRGPSGAQEVAERAQQRPARGAENKFGVATASQQAKNSGAAFTELHKSPYFLIPQWGEATPNRQFHLIKENSPPRAQRGGNFYKQKPRG